jgi:hypothetical protein
LVPIAVEVASGQDSSEEISFLEFHVPIDVLDILVPELIVLCGQPSPGSGSREAEARCRED